MIIQPTNKKNYYIYESDNYKFIIIDRFKSSAIMTSMKDTPIAHKLIDQLYIRHSFIKSAYVDSNELCIISKSKDRKDIEVLINACISYFKENHIHHVCHNCGEEKDVSFVQYYDEIDILCDDCMKVEPVHEQNILKGLLSVALYFLIPVLLWIYLHPLGYIVSLTGILYGLSVILYKKLSGYLYKRDFLYISILWFIYTVIAQIIVYAIEIKEVITANWQIDITLFQSLSLLPEFFDTSLLMTSLTYIGLTFFIMCIVFLIIYKIYQKKNKQFSHYERLHFPNVEK